MSYLNTLAWQKFVSPLLQLDVNSSIEESTTTKTTTQITTANRRFMQETLE